MRIVASVFLGLFALLLSPLAAKASVVTYNFTSTVEYAEYVHSMGSLCESFPDASPFPDTRASCADPSFIAAGSTSFGFVTFDTETSELIDCSTGFDDSFASNCSGFRNDDPRRQPRYDPVDQTLELNDTSYVWLRTLTIGPEGGSFNYVGDESGSYFRETLLTFSDVTVGPLPGCEPSGNRPPRCSGPTPNVVPLPASLPLLLAGVAGLGFLRRRQRSD